MTSDGDEWPVGYGWVFRESENDLDIYGHVPFVKDARDLCLEVGGCYMLYDG